MKGILVALLAAGFAAFGFGVSHAAADSYSVNSNTSLSAGTSGVCAGTSLEVQKNGRDVANQSESHCAP